MATGGAQYFPYARFLQAAARTGRAEVDEIDACNQKQQRRNARKDVAMLDVTLDDLVRGEITFQVHITHGLEFKLCGFFLAYKTSVPTVYLFFE